MERLDDPIASGDVAEVRAGASAAAAVVRHGSPGRGDARPGPRRRPHVGLDEQTGPADLLQEPRLQSLRLHHVEPQVPPGEGPGAGADGAGPDGLQAEGLRLLPGARGQRAALDRPRSLPADRRATDREGRQGRHLRPRRPGEVRLPDQPGGEAFQALPQELCALAGGRKERKRKRKGRRKRKDTHTPPVETNCPPGLQLY